MSMKSSFCVSVKYSCITRSPSGARSGQGSIGCSGETPTGFTAFLPSECV